MITVEQLNESRDLCVSFLRSVEDRDWTTPIPDLEFDVRQLVAHIAQTGFWYSIDFSARGVDLTAVMPEIKVDSEPADLIAALHVGFSMLAAVIDAAPADARGFHPFGQADATGFAAMACDEILIHTQDIAQAFDVGFTPPAELTQSVLERLFPWVEGDEDSFTLLRYANGRIALSARPRLEKWRWHCAPLDEWDGTAP